MVSCTTTRASSNGSLPSAIPTAASAAANAASTAPSSRTVVPAMSRHARAKGPITGRTPAAASVSAAMAGAQVMPRPPGPVTSHTPGSISSRRQTAPSMHWA